MPAPDSNRQVVITGVGVVSPNGVGRDAFWQSMAESISGIESLGREALPGFPVQFGGLVKEFEPQSFIKPRKRLKLMCREIQLGMAAASLAVEDAHLESDQIAPERLGVIYGSEMLYGDPREIEDLYRASVKDDGFSIGSFGRHLLAQLFPLWMLKYLPNMGACHVGIAHNACAHNNTIVQGEASSLLALVEAALKIQDGTADVMIAGGIGSMLSYTRQVINGSSQLSRRSDDPTAACRPFDADRDGQVMGEGSGALILESRQHAESRRAKVLAHVRGFGRTFGSSPSGLHPGASAISASIQRALDVAGITPNELGHINAQGSGRVAADRVEAQAIQATVGQIPVTAPKSLIGNLGTGSGAVEAVVSVLALENELVPPTLNYQTPDPECPVNVVSREPLPTDKPAALVLNQALTGQAVAVVLSRG